MGEIGYCNLYSYYCVHVDVELRKIRVTIMVSAVNMSRNNTRYASDSEKQILQSIDSTARYIDLEKLKLYGSRDFFDFRLILGNQKTTKLKYKDSLYQIYSTNYIMSHLINSKLSWTSLLQFG